MSSGIFLFCTRTKRDFFSVLRRRKQLMQSEEKKNIAIELSKQGLSTREVAKRLNIHYSTVSRWLKEKEKLIEGVCPVCGTKIYYTRGHRPKRFCSDKCCIKWWREHNEIKAKRYLHTCEHCGKPFKSMKRYQRFCCRSCYLDEVCGHE